MRCNAVLYATYLGQEGGGEAALAAVDEGGVVSCGGIPIELDDVVRCTAASKLRELHLEHTSLARGGGRKRKERGKE